MRVLRLLNPIRTLRLEREIAALRKQREADSVHIRSHIESIGRQALPGEITELRGQVALLWNSIDLMTTMVASARDELSVGNVHKGYRKLVDILDAIAPTQQQEAS